MRGTPVATRYTSEFVARHLPDGARDILEVGCGRGEVAAALGGGSLNVLGVDSDADSIAACAATGVEAQLLEWPADLGGNFDAVLFTRSLHHIHDLDGAIAAAVAALRPGGRLIVEDFRAEGGTARSTAWFTGLVRLLDAAGAFRADFNLQQTLAKTDAVDHEHPLHSSSAINQALAKLGPVEAEDAAYYFRYAEAELHSGEASRQFLEHELALIGTDAIDALGKRFVLAP